MRSNRLLIIGGLLVLILALALVATYSVLNQRAASTEGSELAGAAGGRGQDPILGFNYMLNCQGKVTAYFTTATGLGAEVEVVEHKVVGQNGQEVTRLLPGRVRYHSLTLTRGLTSDTGLHQWYALVLAGRANEAVAGCELSMFDRTGTQVAAWQLNETWPSIYLALATKPDGSTPELPIESITLVYSSMERIK